MPQAGPGRSRLRAALVGLFSAACAAQEDVPIEQPQGASVRVAQPADSSRETSRFEFSSVDYWSSGITYRVSSPNRGSMNRVTVTASGLARGDSTIEVDVDGTVTGAEVGDLNADGLPEIYVYVNSAGSGSYGSLVGYSPNDEKSLSPIHLRPVSETAGASEGYMGHDEFAVVESSLVRRFPVYVTGDTNAQPTGGTRQLQYRLEASEAGWLLTPYRVREF